jgi:hypothetical protein
VRPHLPQSAERQELALRQRGSFFCLLQVQTRGPIMKRRTVKQTGQLLSPFMNEQAPVAKAETVSLNSLRKAGTAEEWPRYLITAREANRLRLPRNTIFTAGQRVGVTRRAGVNYIRFSTGGDILEIREIALSRVVAEGTKPRPITYEIENRLLQEPRLPPAAPGRRALFGDHVPARKRTTQRRSHIPGADEASGVQEHAIRCWEEGE